MASESTIRSNTEWLAILFKDRPIVRDYKEMLDIETTLFDVAYFRSKQVDLTQPFEWDLMKSFNSLIKKYQGVWLLEPWSEIKWSETLANIMYDLVAMNAAMRNDCGNIMDVLEIWIKIDVLGIILFLSLVRKP